MIYILNTSVFVVFYFTFLLYFTYIGILLPDPLNDKRCVPLQHLPLQESVKVHAVPIVCEWISTQVVMDGPGPTHNTAGSAKAVTTENMVQPKIQLAIYLLFISYIT